MARDRAGYAALQVETLMMLYHSATIDLLGRELVFSPAAASDTAAAEARLNLRLPQSVREWYGLEDAIALLAEHSNEDPPIPVREFSAVSWRGRRLLPFRWENQGVCIWAVELDGSDDPPVWVQESWAPEEWFVHADSFSEYVTSCVWDYQTVFNQPAMVQAQNRPLTSTALRELQQRFRPEITTHGWPGDEQYRFKGQEGAVLIWAGRDQSDWFAAAPDADSLQSTLESLWELDEVGNAFYDCSTTGRAVLEKIRAKNLER